MKAILDAIRSLLKQTLTDNSGESYEILRLSAGMGVTMFVVLAAVDVLIKGEPFDPESYGIGFGAVVAAAGTAIRIKEGSLPVPEKKPEEGA